MSKPSSRQELIDYALRKLGEPVIKVNVDTEQLEDRVDDALQIFQEYHDDGIERTILKHEITASDVATGISSGYLEVDVPDTVFSVIDVFPVADGFSDNFFDVKYQMILNDIYNWSDLDLVGYDMVQQNLNMLDGMLNQPTNYEFRRVKNKLKVYLNTTGFSAGTFVIFEVWRILDPDTYTEIYNNILLKRYLTSLIKQQWGANLSKFDGIQMPGGVTFNGQQIYESASQDLEKLEEEMRAKYEEPPMGFVE